ncbi:50S ribosomal protein L18, chloroplastic-like isoform X1 [Macadamia integrifolia]|uniref:50S ribosomal protein L18, chloroplastic-like isoform X1 n=1 Tax=Macadamia integrifolia TaxID=60698 RepID=UPI001C5292D6|nr:50S ribosomal protein L18, chloroplastic-like isoform X1 [Macadamia integrifolia]XP_042476973.1 50S ribosomal protein L18, chloroplastic-like isoform X1 [Macadamia integrifolia]
MSVSLSFLHNAFASSQQFSLPSKSVAPTTLSSPLIVAKARTRGDDRLARHSRIRKKVEGTPERPRLSVFRSNKHLYVQVIDDSKMHTLASASTMQKPITEVFDYTSGPTICRVLNLGSFLHQEVAKKVGEVIAKSCLEKGITKVAFDRGGYPYHGRIEALADAAREYGLQF